MSRKRGGQSDYPTGLTGPKCGSIVFSSDVKPMVEFAIRDNGYLVENNFFHTSSVGGGINYIAAQFKITGGYRTEEAALRTLYRCLHETPIMGATMADALAIACETSLYTEDIREYPSRLKAAMEMVFVEADERGEVLSPFDLEERANLLWHETYDRYVVEMEPFKEKYEIARVKRQECRARRFQRLTGGTGVLA